LYNTLKYIYNQGILPQSALWKGAPLLFENVSLTKYSISYTRADIMPKARPHGMDHV